MTRNNRLLRAANVAYARRHWPTECSSALLSKLRELTTTFSVSVVRGDICLVNGTWYITNGGLLRIAQKRRCIGIQSRVLAQFCHPSQSRWVFKATVFRSYTSTGFTGYGDADPTNVSPLVRGAEMRVAETRAVNRALRKAYGIGLCSVEELGWTPKVSPTHSSRNGSSPAGANGNGHNAPPRLRDRLCLLIREHQLDPALVKAYAADYCGTPALHNASREQVEAFIGHLTERATKNRASLLCHLNSFARPQEVSS
jgi:hypothetical protein